MNPDQISASCLDLWRFHEPGKIIIPIDFQEIEEGTVVCVKEYGYADTVEGHHRCLECATGWGEALTLLKFYSEHGLRY
ncbi:MAG: hypothetical protein ACFFDT_12285 [Candidatus Hodarchaeota archaeon]